MNPILPYGLDASSNYYESNLISIDAHSALFFFFFLEKDCNRSDYSFSEPLSDVDGFDDRNLSKHEAERQALIQLDKAQASFFYSILNQSLNKSSCLDSNSKISGKTGSFCRPNKRLI